MCPLCWIWRSGSGDKDSRLLWDHYRTDNEGLQHLTDVRVGTLLLFCCWQHCVWLICGQQILNRWFESEPLKATLATDGVIGAMISPSNPGSGWVTSLSHPELQFHCVSVNAPHTRADIADLALKVCAAAPCDGRAGEGERRMGLCGGRHGWGVSGHRQLGSISWCRHFHWEGIPALKLSSCSGWFRVEV